ncbi:MAG: hypothetical protein LUQ47_04405 [Methanotrichaceae archaeon]|nr:hypothetical protein [Methanotrichaceae archaeon]
MWDELWSVRQLLGDDERLEKKDLVKSIVLAAYHVARIAPLWQSNATCWGKALCGSALNAQIIPVDA